MIGENGGARKSLLRLFRRALGVDNLAFDVSQRLSMDLRAGLNDVQTALEASADMRASQQANHFASALNLETGRSATFLEDAVTRQSQFQIDQIITALNQAAHHNTAYLEGALSRQFHLRMEELVVALNQEAHRNAAYLEEALTRQVHLRTAESKQDAVRQLQEAIGDELQRNIAYIDSRLTEHFANQHDAHNAFEANRPLPNNTEVITALKDSQALVLQELHRQMSHVDTHLSAHVTKELSLHLGSQDGGAINRSGAALAQQRLLTLGKLLEPQAVIGKNKIRIGHESDGGYVMLDDFGATRFALSLGVGAEMTWDVAMADLGLDVHQFDYTIEAPPFRHDRVYFHQSRIAAIAEGTDHSLSSAQTLGGRQICIIKMDIEGDEWSVLDAAVEGDFDNVTQLICEFHDFDKVDDERWFNCAERVLRSLSEIFCVVHVHANNNGALNVRGNMAFPEILEVSFANKRFYEFEATREVFPTPLDAPNRQDLPDIVLGAFRF
jgi:hypothetical protein